MNVDPQKSNKYRFTEDVQPPISRSSSNHEEQVQGSLFNSSSFLKNYKIQTVEQYQKSLGDSQNEDTNFMGKNKIATNLQLNQSVIAEEQEGSSNESVDYLSRVNSVPIKQFIHKSSSELEESDYHSSASEKEKLEKPNSLKNNKEDKLRLE